MARRASTTALGSVLSFGPSLRQSVTPGVGGSARLLSTPVTPRTLSSTVSPVTPRTLSSKVLPVTPHTRSSTPLPPVSLPAQTSTLAPVTPHTPPGIVPPGPSPTHPGALSPTTPVSPSSTPPSGLSPVGSTTAPTKLDYGRKHFSDPGSTASLVTDAISTHLTREALPGGHPYPNTHAQGKPSTTTDFSLVQPLAPTKKGVPQDHVLIPANAIVTTRRENPDPGPENAGAGLTVQEHGAGYMVALKKGNRLVHHEDVLNQLPLSNKGIRPTQPPIFGAPPVLDPATDQRARSMGWRPSTETDKL
jgi:hypothetical protein